MLKSATTYHGVAAIDVDLEVVGSSAANDTSYGVDLIGRRGHNGTHDYLKQQWQEDDETGQNVSFNEDPESLEPQDSQLIEDAEKAEFFLNIFAKCW